MTPQITGVPNTCPDIDDAQDYISEIQDILLCGEIDQYALKAISKLAANVYDILEYLRDSNSTLREKAHEYYEKMINLENEIEDIRSDYEST